MCRRIRLFSAVALICGALGCQHPTAANNNTKQPDPLLISKKPVEGKPTSYERPANGWREPRLPDAVSTQPILDLPAPVGYRPTEDGGVSIGKPRLLPDQR